MSLRPRRRAHEDRPGARSCVEEHVRRVPRSTGRSAMVSASSRSTRCADYDEYVDGKPRYDGVRSFLAAAGNRACPRGRRTIRRARRRSAGSAIGRTSSCSTLIRARGVRCTRGRCATCTRFGTRACGARSSRRAPTAARCWSPRGSRSSSRVRVDGLVAERLRLPGKPAPDMFLAAARGLACRPARRGGVRGCARRRRAGRAGPVRLRRRRSTGSGRRTRCVAHGADVVVADLAELLDTPVIAHPNFAVEPWSLRETRARPRRACTDGVDVRACERSHRPARQPRRGGAVRRFPGPISTRSTSCGRCRTPRAGYGYPESGQTIVNVTNGKIIRLARRRRAFRRPLRRAARARARARPASRRAAPLGRVGLAGRGGGAHPLDTARLVRPAHDRSDPLSRWRRSTERCASSVQSELVANEPAPARSADPRAAAALESPFALGGAFTTTSRSCSCTQAARASFASPRRWTTSSRGLPERTPVPRARRMSAG